MFIGQISIRHGLTKELEKYGGHIGYYIRYIMRNKGYGTLILRLALEYINNNFNFEQVLLTCNDTNIYSIRVIEKNGGVLFDKINNTIDGVDIITRRYWIKLNNSCNK